LALKISYPHGATPLDPDELEGLLASGISTRNQLDELEAANVAEALQWAGARGRDVLTEDYARELHRRMFGKVWKWAGAYRTSQKNIGIASHDIPAAMRDLMKDTAAQVEGGQPAREVALRFHHRLTRIHAFANGNGRHARLLTDLLLERLGLDPFAWGDDLQHSGDPRSAYIDALRCADNKDYSKLRQFLGFPRMGK